MSRGPHSRPHDPIDEDDRLIQLGYSPSLSRNLNGVVSFAIGFTRINVILGIIPLLGYGLSIGGPVCMVFGWIFCSFMTILVTLSLSEICAAFPTTGSVYNWTSHLSSPAWAPILSYSTGLMSWLGNTTGSATNSLYVSQLASCISTAFGQPQLSACSEVVLAEAVLTVSALTSCLRIEQIGVISNGSAVVLGLTFMALCGSLFFMAPTTKSPDFVFLTFENTSGLSSPFFVVALSLLFPLFSFDGFEASSLIAEETKEASTAAPTGMITSVIASAIGGFVTILAILFSIQNLGPIVNGQDNSSILILLQQATSPVVTLCLLFLLLLNSLLCSVTNNLLASRITYAMAREGILPASKWIAQVDSSMKTPNNAVIFNYMFNFVILLLPLTATGRAAFASIASLNTFGFQISYALPIFCRYIFGSNIMFEFNSFRLGKYSKTLAIVNSVWLFVTSLVILMPTQYPITYSNMNYSLVAVLVFVFVGWINWTFFSYKSTEVFHIEEEVLVYSNKDDSYSL